MSLLSKFITLFGGSIKSFVTVVFLLTITFGVVLTPVGSNSIEVNAQAAAVGTIGITGVSLGTSQEISNKIIDVINFFVYIFGAIAVGVIVYGGFLFMNNKPDDGMKWVKNGAIGLAIALIATILVSIVAGVVSTFSDQLTTSSGSGSSKPAPATPE